jgi:UDP-N-acetylglucosamine transferase subunit ALG13
MIFVSVGTNEAPFERLVRGAEALADRDELVIQYGSSAYRPKRARCVDFLPFEEIVEHVRAASAVVVHAGVGSITVALLNGRMPVVVPRQRAFGEAVDDHQVSFARRLASTGLVVLVEDPAALARVALPEPRPELAVGESELAKELEEYLVCVLGPTPRARS